MTLTRASFSGEERQLPAGDGAPKVDKATGVAKPPMKDLSPADRVATASHLAATVAGDAGHVFVHLKRAAEEASKLTGQAHAASTVHNAQHAATHAMSVVDHAEKLQDHLAHFPGAAAAAKELSAAVPSKVPKRPGK